MSEPISRTTLIRTAAVGIAACAVAFVAVVGAPSASAATPASSAPLRASTAADATIRAAHLSPDMPGVDVYLTSFSGRTTSWITDATYGQVSPYMQVSPGAYTFSVRTHGAAMSTPALETWTLSAKAGYAYTAAVVGSGETHRGVVLNDNLTPPAAGHANVRLIQASSRSGTADVVAQAGPVIAQNAAFGTSTGYASVKAGTWPLQATGDGQKTDADVSLAAGSVTSLILLDAPQGGTRLTSITDAAGSPTRSAPRGSVDAGGGGTATSFTATSHHHGVAPLVVVVLGLGLAGVLVVARRRRLHRVDRTG